MLNLKLVKETDEILKKPCPKFDFEMAQKDFDPKTASLTEYLSTLSHEMSLLMGINNGIGLAAPQVGLNLRLFVMRIDSEEICCINPEIIENSEEISIYPEGCLSFPELRLNIKRPSSIFVRYQGINGAQINRHMDGLMARCFQHELDHLNGITFDTLVPKLSLQLANRKRRQILKKLKRRGK